jgi:2,4-dienoyl-CoA reductase-like NADH-dependent reductase (Old Yellow Enzyme family)
MMMMMMMMMTIRLFIVVVVDVIHSSPGYVEPLELSVKQIEKHIQLFKKAAEFAKQAGFDGVELQGRNTSMDR